MGTATLPRLAIASAEVHDGGMGSTGETRKTVPGAASPEIVWETRRAPSVSAARVRAPAVRRVANRWSAILSRPTFAQIHGRSPMETIRILRTPSAQAADVLSRSIAIEWGRGIGAGHLSLGPFRAAPSELGRPWVADAILEGYGVRRLRVTVAIFRDGNERCGIQVRPRFRRPRTSRRLRHCLRSTHGAADRLRDLVLAVDFMPPGDTAMWA